MFVKICNVLFPVVHHGRIRLVRKQVQEDPEAFRAPTARIDLPVLDVARMTRPLLPGELRVPLHKDPLVDKPGDVA